jgi:hypothetical protein
MIWLRKESREIFADMCVMIAEGFSLLITNYFFLSFFLQLADNGPDLFETPYTATLETFINLHLKHQRSVPVFLSAITIDLFSHQTIDSSHEHSTFG